MWDFPGIMAAQAVLEVVGQADIEMLGFMFTLKNVNVGKGHTGLPAYWLAES